MGTGMIGMQWIIFIGVAVVSWLVQMNLQSKFKKYSKIPTGNGMTGADVALKMLHDNGIYDVTVTHTPGHLTDHYNRICSVDNAQQAGAGGVFCLTVDDVVAAGRYLDAELLSATVAGGHYTVCIDNFIQLHHLAGGNQCK